MTNLQTLDAQIVDFLSISGDDINDVINHGDTLAFSHISLTAQNFSHEITISESGEIKLTKQVAIANESALDQNVESGSARTILEQVTVKTAQIENIQDVIEFIYSV